MGWRKEYRQLALKQVGKPYRFGAEVNLNDPNPKAFDCSELPEYLTYRTAKVHIPDGSYNQYDASTPVHVKNLKIGDLGFYRKPTGTRRIYHVAPYVGYGQVVNAKGRRYGTIKQSRAGFEGRNFVGWRRPNKIVALDKKAAKEAKKVPIKTEKQKAIEWVKNNRIMTVVNGSSISRNDLAIVLYRNATREHKKNVTWFEKAKSYFRRK